MTFLLQTFNADLYELYGLLKNTINDTPMYHATNGDKVHKWLKEEVPGITPNENMDM